MDNWYSESLYKCIKYTFARDINIFMLPMLPHQFIQDLIFDQHSTRIMVHSWVKGNTGTVIYSLRVKN
jgi:hypothetical protein